MRQFIKITSGIFRGRNISTPGGKTHPMGERERLALFNMISEYLPKAAVLDAYAGSGALGIEAVSRGADKVLFVDKSADAVRTIKKNLEVVGIQGNYEVRKLSISEMADIGIFDIVLADPPYDSFKVAEVMNLLGFIRQGGILALSHPGEAPKLPEMSLEKSRKYAGATISIYVKR